MEVFVKLIFSFKKIFINRKCFVEKWINWVYSNSVDFWMEKFLLNLVLDLILIVKLINDNWMNYCDFFVVLKDVFLELILFIIL